MVMHKELQVSYVWEFLIQLTFTEIYVNILFIPSPYIAVHSPTVVLAHVQTEDFVCERERGGYVTTLSNARIIMSMIENKTLVE
jgi:hypothetical protein